MKKWMWIVLVLPVILAGCNLFNRDFSREDLETGSLVLLLDGNTIGTKTIAPPNMTAAKYDIVLTSPTAAVTTVTDHPSLAYSKNGLQTGVWTVKVTAKDAGGVAIGAISGSVSGTDTFTILAGQVASKSVKVIPLVGTGGLSLSLTWPDGTVNSPVTVAAWLVPETATDSYTNHPITFAVTEATRTAAYAVPLSPGLTSGYYTLLVQLSGAGSVVWGWAESVRIVTGLTTTGLLTLVAGTGGLSLSIVVDMENPITINWGTTPPTSITVAQSLNLTATPASSAATGYGFSYQWYLNGSPLTNETAAALTYGPTYSDPAFVAGDYSMCVVVAEKLLVSPFTVRTISSNGFNFRVTP